MKYSYAIALFAFAALHADDCSLRGAAVSDDGAPAAGVEVVATSYRAFRGGTAYTTKTGADGSFSFKGLSCGKYMVYAASHAFDSAGAMPRSVTVDIKKQPVIQLKVPNGDPLASLLYVAPSKDPEPADIGAKRPAQASEAVEDASTTRLRREYFERLSPSELAAFDAAPLAAKKTMYAMAVTRRMMGITGVETAKSPRDIARAKAVGHEEDQQSRMQLMQATKIIRERLSPADADAFANVSEIEEARMFLRAVAALPDRPTSNCSMFGLMMAELDVQTTESNVGRMLDRLLDDRTVGRWNDLDIKGRCALMGRISAKLMQMAKGIDADGSIENVKDVVEKIGVQGQEPRQMVESVFGHEGLRRYDDRRGTNEKLEIFRAALMMNLCWYTAYEAM